MKKEMINGHLGFQNIDTHVEVPAFEPTTCDGVSVKNDKIIDIIFAVDTTGFPDASAAVALVHSTDPVVREFIQSKLLQKLPAGASVEDADTALELTQRYGESVDDYSARITDYVSKLNKVGKYSEKGE